RGRLHARRCAALRVRARAAATPPGEAGRDVGDPRLAALDGDGRRARAPARRPRTGRHLRHGGRRVGEALHRRPELLLLPRGHPEDHPLATVTSRHGATRVPVAARPAPRRAARPQRGRPRSLAGTLVRAAMTMPLAARLVAVSLLLLIALGLLNIAYQVSRK